MPDLAGSRPYGNVSNALEVVQSPTRRFTVAVAVPTPLFTYMLLHLRWPKHTEVTLHIDRVGDWSILCMMLHQQGKEDICDLWAYPKASIPAWMLDPAFHL